MKIEEDVAQETNASHAVEEKFRLIGFKALFVFSIVMALVVCFQAPNNFLIAIIFPGTWLTLSTISLFKRSYGRLLGRICVLFTVSLAPFLIIANGIVPATLVCLGVILCVLLVSGLWRVVSALMLACMTLLVPYSSVDYDVAVWVRLCVSNIAVTIVLLTILRYLEKALVDSLENAKALMLALDGQRKANETQSLFLATMSHEIRTPMNGMLGLLDVVLENDLSEKQRSHLKKVQRSSHLLQNILNGILDYSKLKAGKLVFETAPLNIGQLVLDSSALFQMQAENKGIKLTTNINPLLGVAHLGDATRIVQILNNLLSNAIKFTPEGDVSLSVKVVNTTKEAQLIQFCVSDSGIGISEAETQRIFSPFTQVNQAENHHIGGTGLGLQIVKSLVEQMGGEIWVESVQGVGSQFYVSLTLPLTSKPLGNIVNNSKYPNKKFQGKILVVEDNKINRLVAKEMLQASVTEISFAHDGLEAVSAVDKETYDLLLMDLNMPNMDGFEATKAIRKKHPNIPIVALTAAVLADEVEKALASGMNGHLAKPIEKDKLLNVLELYLKPEN